MVVNHIHKYSELSWQCEEEKERSIIPSKTTMEKTTHIDLDKEYLFMAKPREGWR